MTILEVLKHTNLVIDPMTGSWGQREIGCYIIKSNKHYHQPGNWQTCDPTLDRQLRQRACRMPLGAMAIQKVTFCPLIDVAETTVKIALKM